MEETCILLIDDDADDQMFFRLAVREIDPKAVCKSAYHGADGLKILAEMEKDPDIIFLDLNMPVMNGIECLQKIRKIPNLTDTPIIIFSTSNDDKDVGLTQKLGASGYLLKPNDNQELIAKLKKILSTDFKVSEKDFVF